jgi:hypothetical protein
MKPTEIYHPNTSKREGERKEGREGGREGQASLAL